MAACLVPINRYLQTQKESLQYSIPAAIPVHNVLVQELPVHNVQVQEKQVKTEKKLLLGMIVQIVGIVSI